MNNIEAQQVELEKMISRLQKEIALKFDIQLGDELEVQERNTDSFNRYKDYIYLGFSQYSDEMEEVLVAARLAGAKRCVLDKKMTEARNNFTAGIWDILKKIPLTGEKLYRQLWVDEQNRQFVNRMVAGRYKKIIWTFVPHPDDPTDPKVVRKSASYIFR